MSQDNRKVQLWVLVRERDGEEKYWRGQRWVKVNGRGRHEHEWADIPMLGYHFMAWDLAMTWAREAFSHQERRYLRAIPL